MASSEFESITALMAAGRVMTDTPNEAARIAYDALGTMIPLVDDTITEPLDPGAGVPGEWVRAPGASVDRVIVWLHGGGYVIGSSTSHRPLASRISAASGASVLLVDYRLAPEHPYPAALEDALAAHRFLLDRGFEPARMALGGDSAGGGLALATLLRLRDDRRPLPAAFATSSPLVDLTLTSDSITTNLDTDIILSPELLAHWIRIYVASGDRDDPSLAPLTVEAHGLPPMLVHVARGELLYDDAVRLVEWAKRDGVDATLEVDDEMVHHWHVWAGLFPEADAAVERLGSWIGENLR